MQLLVKTLKGEKFQIEVEDTQTFAEVKATIVRFKAANANESYHHN